MWSYVERFVAYLCAFSIFYAYTIGPVHAQTPPTDPGIIVDPESDVGFRPGIWYNENDHTPVVDITTPQNGISLNRYEEFDVDENGVVLNNSTQEGVSALAGTLRANPNLQGLAADIIINEVTSGNASELSGAIEVFGQSADVIVANPNGITANGTSFINTNRATLTTGAPTRRADGSFDHEVREGHIEIGRNGIQGGGADAVQIAGRTVRIDGAISGGDELIVSGGAQDFDPVTGEAVGASSSSNAASSFAVDATAYGVMQGDSIKIMGNEAGLGVRALGNLSSGTGGTDIMSLDSLILGSSNTTGNLTAQAAGALTVTKDITAQGDITLEAGTDGTGTLTIDTPTGSGGLYSGGTATLSAGTDVNLDGDIQVLENLNVTGRNITSDAEVSALAGNINLDATQNVDVSAGRLSAAAINIDAGEEARIGDTYIAAADVNVSATDVALGEGAIFSADAIVLTALEDFENAAQLVGTGEGALNLSLSFTQDFRNLASGLYLWDAIDLTIAGSLTNSGWIQGEESVALTLGSLNNLTSGVISGGTITVNTSGDFVNVGDIIADTVLNITAQQEILNTGRLSSGGNISLDAVERLRQSGYIAAEGDVSLSSDANINTYVGGIINRTDANGEAIEIPAGLLIAGNDIIIDAGTVFVNSADAILQAENLLDVVAGSNLANYGTLAADAGVVITAGGYIINQGGSIIFAGQAADENGEGEVLGDITLNTGTYITNRAEAVIRATGDVLATSTTATSNSGEVNGRNISFNSGNYIRNYGRLQADNNLTLIANTSYIRNYEDSAILGGGDIIIDAASYISLTAGSIIDAGGSFSAISRGGSVNSYGLIQAGSDANFTTIDGYIYNRTGSVINIGGNITQNAGTYTHLQVGSQLHANGDIRLTSQAGNLSSYGLINGQNDVFLESNDGYIINRGSGVINAERDIVLDSSNYISNYAGGVIDAGGDLTATSTNYIYNNIGASIDVDGTVSFDAPGLIRDYGTLSAGSVAFTAHRVDTRRDGDYTLNGTVIANSYYANVGGTWRDTAGSSLMIGDSPNLGNDLRIHADGNITLRGDLSTQGQSTLTAGGNLYLYDTASLGAESNLTAAVEGYITNYGEISSGAIANLNAGAYFYNSFNTNTGSVVADTALWITAGTSIRNYNLLQAGTSVNLNAGTSLVNLADARVEAGTINAAAGNIIATTQAGSLLNYGTMDAANDVWLTSNGGYINNVAGSYIRAGQSVNQNAGTSLGVNGDSLIEAEQDIILRARGSTLNVYGTLDAGNDVWLTSNVSTITNRSTGVINAELGSVNLNAGTSIGLHSNSDIVAGQDIIATANAGNINNATLLDAGNDIWLTSYGGYIRNLASAGAYTGHLKADRNVNINAGTYFQNQASAVVEAGHDIIVTSQAGNINNYSVIDAGNDVWLTSSNGNIIINRGTGVIDAERNVNFISGSYINNYAGGVINAGADLIATAETYFYNQSTIDVGGDATITTRGTDFYNYADASLDVEGLLTINAARNIKDYGTLSAGSIDFDAGSLVETRRDGDYTLNGTVNAGSYLADVGRWIGVESDNVTTTGTLSITGSTLYNRGILDAGTDLTLTAGTYLSNWGSLLAGDDIVLTSGVRVNNYNLVQTVDDLTVTSGGYILNRDAGVIKVGGDAILTSSDYIGNIQNSLIDVEGNLTASVTDGYIYNSGSTIDVEGDFTAIAAGTDGYIHNYGNSTIDTLGIISLISDSSYVRNAGSILAGSLYVEADSFRNDIGADITVTNDATFVLTRHDVEYANETGTLPVAGTNVVTTSDASGFGSIDSGAVSTLLSQLNGLVSIGDNNASFNDLISYRQFDEYLNNGSINVGNWTSAQQTNQIVASRNDITVANWEWRNGAIREVDVVGRNAAQREIYDNAWLDVDNAILSRNQAKQTYDNAVSNADAAEVTAQDAQNAAIALEAQAQELRDQFNTHTNTQTQKAGSNTGHQKTGSPNPILNVTFEKTLNSNDDYNVTGTFENISGMGQLFIPDDTPLEATKQQAQSTANQRSAEVDAAEQALNNHAPITYAYYQDGIGTNQNSSQYPNPYGEAKFEVINGMLVWHYLDVIEGENSNDPFGDLEPVDNPLPIIEWVMHQASFTQALAERDAAAAHETTRVNLQTQVNTARSNENAAQQDLSEAQADLDAFFVNITPGTYRYLDGWGGQYYDHPQIGIYWIPEIVVTANEDAAAGQATASTAQNNYNHLYSLIDPANINYNDWIDQLADYQDIADATPEFAETLYADLETNGLAQSYRAFSGVYTSLNDSDVLTRAHQLASGSLSEVELSEALLNSSQGQAEYGGLSDAEFINRAYANLFGDEASATDLGYWGNRLRNGESRAELFTNFLQSEAYQDISNPGLYNYQSILLSEQERHELADYNPQTSDYDQFYDISEIRDALPHLQDLLDQFGNDAVNTTEWQEIVSTSGLTAVMDILTGDSSALAAGTLALGSGDFQNAGTIEVGSAAYIDGTKFVNSGSITADEFTADVTDYFDNVTDGIDATSSISVSARDLRDSAYEGLVTTGDFALNILEGDILYGDGYDYGGDLSLQASGVVKIDTALDIDGDLTLIGGQNVNFGQYDLSATGDLVLDTGSHLSLQSDLTAGSDIYLFADSLDVASGAEIEAADTLVADLNGALRNSGIIRADVVSISAESIINTVSNRYVASPDTSGYNSALDARRETYATLIDQYGDLEFGGFSLSGSYGLTGLVDFTAIGELAVNQTNATNFIPTNGSISGREVYLDAENVISNSGVLRGEDILSVNGGTLSNDGTIYSGDLLDITLEGNLNNNQGTITAGSIGDDDEVLGILRIDAGGDIVNNRGTIKSNDLATLIAGGSIRNTATSGQRTENYVYNAQISAGSRLWLEAGQDIVNQGGSISATGDLIASAGNDIRNQANQTYVTIDSSYGCESRACGRRAVDYVAADIGAGGSLSLEAGNDIRNFASNIGGFEDTFITAGNDIINEAYIGKYTQIDIKKSSWFGLKKKRELVEAGLLRVGTIQSLAGDLFIEAGTNDVDGQGDIINRGSVLSAGNDLRLIANNDILFTAMVQELENYEKKRGFSGFSYGSISRKWNDHAVALSSATGYDVSMFAGRDLIGEATFVSAFNDLTLDAGRDLEFDAEQLRKYYEESGWSIGISFPGSNFLSAIATGDVDTIAKAYLNENPFMSSVYALANSETGFEGAANLINVSTQAAGLGARLSTAYGANGPNSGVGGLIDQLQGELNPLSGLQNAWSATPEFDADGNPLPTNITDNIKNFAKSITVSLSVYKNRQDWTESLLSELQAGNDLIISAENDINLIGGTQTYAGGDAYIVAGNNILLAAAHDWNRSRNRSLGATLGFSGGFTVGLNGSNSNSDSENYTTANLNVGGDLFMEAGHDISLVGAIVSADNAVINAGNDLRVQSLQNTSYSRNSNWGFSVTFCGTAICAASANAGGGNSDRQWTDDVAGIYAQNDLDITVEGTTYLVGGALAAGLADPDVYVLPTGWSEVIRSVPESTVELPDGTTTVVAAHDITEYCNADNECQVQRPASARIIAGLPDGWTVEEREVPAGFHGTYYDPEFGEWLPAWREAYIETQYCDAQGECQTQAPPLDRSKGQLTLTTGSLQMFNLIDTQSSQQWSLSASIGRPDADSSFKVNGLGGSYANANKEGITRATISPGVITITSLDQSEQDSLLANINRDTNNIQIVTRDESFDTGNINIDVAGLRDFKGNFKKSHNLIRALNADPDFALDANTQFQSDDKIAVDLYRRTLLSVLNAGGTEADAQQIVRADLKRFNRSVNIHRVYDEIEEYNKNRAEGAEPLSLTDNELGLLHNDVNILVVPWQNNRGADKYVTVPCQTSGTRERCTIKVQEFLDNITLLESKSIFEGTLTELLEDTLSLKGLIGAAAGQGGQYAVAIAQGEQGMLALRFQELFGALMACYRKHPDVFYDFINNDKNLADFAAVSAEFGSLTASELIDIRSSMASYVTKIKNGGTLTTDDYEELDEILEDHISWGTAYGIGVASFALEIEGLADTVGDIGKAAGQKALLLAMSPEERGELLDAVNGYFRRITESPESLAAEIMRARKVTRETAWSIIKGIASDLRNRGWDSVNVTDPLEMGEAQIGLMIEIAFTVLTGGTSAVATQGGKAAGKEILETTISRIAAQSLKKTCSFDGSTLVKTNLGYTAIKDLRAGEHMVWAREEETGNMSYKDIMAQYSNDYAETVYVTLRNQETGSVQTIISNRIHPFFAKLPADNDNVPPSSEGHDYKGEIENGQWVDAQFLAPGYLLLNEDEDWSEVVEIKITKEPLQAFNLTVADYSTYFVKGAANDKDDAIWVHNNCSLEDIVSLGGKALDDANPNVLIGAYGNKFVRQADGSYIKQGAASADEIATSGVQVARNAIDADAILVNGKVPSLTKGFNEWFDDLTPAELDRLWDAHPKIRDAQGKLIDDPVIQAIKNNIRKKSQGGGFHEWCMVCEVRTFKKMGFSMDEIHRYVTPTADLKGVHPRLGPWEHGGKLSGTFHDQLRNIIKTTKSPDDFYKRVEILRKKWGVPDGVMPTPPPPPPVPG